MSDINAEIEQWYNNLNTDIIPFNKLFYNVIGVYNGDKIIDGHYRTQVKTNEHMKSSSTTCYYLDSDGKPQLLPLAIRLQKSNTAQQENIFKMILDKYPDLDAEIICEDISSFPSIYLLVKALFKNVDDAPASVPAPSS
jgi:hypothetical protein